MAHDTTERRIADLKEKLVIRFHVVGNGSTELIARDVAPELRIVIEVNRSTVILIATDAHYLLSGRERQTVSHLRQCSKTHIAI